MKEWSTDTMITAIHITINDVVTAHNGACRELAEIEKRQRYERKKQKQFIGSTNQKHGTLQRMPSTALCITSEKASPSSMLSIDTFVKLQRTLLNHLKIFPNILLPDARTE